MGWGTGRSAHAHIVCLAAVRTSATAAVSDMRARPCAVRSCVAQNDFLHEDNLCGQTLLKLVSRGNSILAELLRLSYHIPRVFLGAGAVQDPYQAKYLDVLFDFSYLKAPDTYEKKLNKKPELIDIDDEFQENHLQVKYWSLWPEPVASPSFSFAFAAMRRPFMRARHASPCVPADDPWVSSVWKHPVRFAHSCTLGFLALRCGRRRASPRRAVPCQCH